MQNQVLFLGFIVSTQEIPVDLDEVKTIREWQELKTLIEACSFHGLVSLLRDSLRDSVPLPPCSLSA